jgi:hypothetical protein
MQIQTVPIESLTDLSKAIALRGPRNLELQTSLLSPYSITLPPGFSLKGKHKESCILSFCNGDGVGLTADNRIENLIVMTTPGARAIYTQTGLLDNPYSEALFCTLKHAPAYPRLPFADVASASRWVTRFVDWYNGTHTHGTDVTTYAVEGGKVGSIDIKGRVLAHGERSDAVLVSKKGSTPLTNVRAAAKAGRNLVVTDGDVTDRTGLVA